IGGLNTGPVAARKRGPRGLKENAACGAPGGAFLRSQGGRRRLRTVSRAASPAAQGASHAPAFPGAPLPWFGERDEKGNDGSPGAEQRIRAMSHARCLKFESVSYDA